MGNFDDFLKENLSAANYESLAELLKAPNSDVPKSPHRITKIKNNPSIMNEHELIELAKIIKKSPAWLVENYECGKVGIPENVLNIIIQSSTAGEQSCN